MFEERLLDVAFICSSPYVLDQPFLRSDGHQCVLCARGRRCPDELPFSGNVRELLNVVERCAALASGKTIRLADLPSHIASTTRSTKTSLSTLQEITAEAERNHIARIVQLAKGNRSKAAEILGISRKTLWEKINTHQLDL